MYLQALSNVLMYLTTIYQFVTTHSAPPEEHLYIRVCDRRTVMYIDLQLIAICVCTVRT